MKTRKKASLTVEAALILPTFMAALLAIVSVLFMYHTGQKIQNALLTYAQDLAVDCADGHNVGVSDIREEIAEVLSDEDVRFIENGMDGIDMSGSFTDDPEYIELCVTCDLIPPIGMFGTLKIPFTAKSLVHVWCGYENGFFPDGEYVYITDDSEGYHRDRDCSHIRRTIEETDPGPIGRMRNSDGKRYRPCGICHAKKTDSPLYVTPEGDRYHNSITCSALKRTVKAIRINETGNRRPCSRCGR